MKDVKHKWTYEENKFCCDLFRDIFIKQTMPYGDINGLYFTASLFYPDIKKSSFIMKMQNIKQICLDYSIKEYSKFKPLLNYSNMNLCAMKESLNEIGVSI